MEPTIDAKALTSHPLGVAAITMIDMVAHQGRIAEAAALFLADPYIQHNPRAPDGIEAFVSGMTALSGMSPDRRYDIKRVFVDGDFVVLHSHVTNGPHDRGNAIMDIYRAVDGRFVEHWDVNQPVPERSENHNTMF